jgi:glycine cleavage system H protein
MVGQIAQGAPMIELPENLVYSLRHIWIDIEDDDDCIAAIGITEHLQEELPEILSIDLPLVGDELEIDAPCVHLHLEDGIRDLVCPLTGRVKEINREVLDNPDLLHVAPYRNWIFRMEFDEPDELDLLLPADKYLSYVETL